MLEAVSTVIPSGIQLRGDVISVVCLLVVLSCHLKVLSMQTSENASIYPNFWRIKMLTLSANSSHEFFRGAARKTNAECVTKQIEMHRSRKICLGISIGIGSSHTRIYDT